MKQCCAYLSADADGSRIALLNLEVHVAQRRIERAGIGVLGSSAGRRPATREEHELPFVRRVVEAWGARSKDERGAVCAVANTRMLGQTYRVRVIRYRPSGTKTIPSLVDSWTASIAFWIASLSSASPSPTAPKRSRVR